MPNRDSTGPEGRGRLTGRRKGICKNTNGIAPVDFMNENYKIKSAKKLRRWK